MKNRSETLKGWLGINSLPDFTKARWLGGLISVFGTILAIFVVSMVLFRFFSALTGFGEFKDVEVQSVAIRNTGLVLAALVGVPFVVWRSFVAQKQVDIAEQGQITDRINQSVQGLGAEKITKTVHETTRYKKDNDGNWLRDDDKKLVPALRPDGTPIIDRAVIEKTEPNLEIRLGAIYALERIAQDSARDHVQIMEILTTYVRENAPLKPDSKGTLEKLRGDIQASLSVIGRRSDNQIEIERSTKQQWGTIGFQLNLMGACLDNANLNGLNFDNVQFAGSQLRGAQLKRTSLRNADFFNCDFSGAQLELADFSGSRIWNVDLVSTKFERLHLDGASLRKSKIQVEIIQQNAEAKWFFLDNTVLDRSVPYSTYMRSSSDSFEDIERRKEKLLDELGVQEYPSDKQAYEAWRDWQLQIGFSQGLFPRWDD